LRTVVTNALLVRQVAYGESDVVATLFTEAEGKLAVMVRGGRKSTKRFGGALEPFHTIEARIDEKGERPDELGALREARIVRVRQGIVASLEAIDAAGIALRWVRHVCPARTREPEAWATLVELLDALDAGGAVSPKVALASAGLRLLSDVGYALDLERCIQCGKECPPGKPARVDPARGGLVCSSCGGARVVLSADLRAKAVAAAARTGSDPRAGRAGTAEGPAAMTAADAEEILAIVDAAMAAHAGFDR
jgi:DNA repair protein RecO (recombination protein O)